MKLHELRQKRDNIARDMRALHESIGENEWTNEQRDSWKGMKGSLDSLDEQIKREEDLRELDTRFVQDNQDDVRNNQDGQREERSIDQRRNEAFDMMLRHGPQEMDAEQRALLAEMRANATNPGDKGGYTVPKEMLNRIHESMKAYGGIANFCQVLTTASGNPINWPTTDGTTEIGELVGENQETGKQDITFGEKLLGAKKLSSKIILVSNELLNDTGVDVQGVIAKRIASRIGRGEAALIATGSGAGTPQQPTGVITAISSGHTTNAVGAISWKDLAQLKHSVDPAYRASPKSAFGFNDNTLLKITEMEDNQGRPIWLPAVAGAAPATVLGERYFIDQAIPDLEAGAKFAAYGDWDQFILRRVMYMVIKRLVERYAEFDQTGFLAFHRFDCVLQDAAAIKALTGRAA